MCEKHRKVSRVALTVLSKKAAYKSEKGYYKWSKAPPERQWKFNTFWKVIKNYDKHLRYIQTTYPEKWDELIQTVTTTSTGSDLNEHCKIKWTGD